MDTNNSSLYNKLILVTTLALVIILILFILLGYRNMKIRKAQEEQNKPGVNITIIDEPDVLSDIEGDASLEYVNVLLNGLNLKTDILKKDVNTFESNDDKLLIAFYQSSTANNAKEAESVEVDGGSYAAYNTVKGNYSRLFGTQLSTYSLANNGFYQLKSATDTEVLSCVFKGKCNTISLKDTTCTEDSCYIVSKKVISGESIRFKSISSSEEDGKLTIKGKSTVGDYTLVLQNNYINSLVINKEA